MKKILQGSKRILQGLKLYLDDLLLLAGIGCLIRAGFLFGEVWGFIVAGFGLIGYGIVVAKGGIDG